MRKPALFVLVSLLALTSFADRPADEAPLEPAPQYVLGVKEMPVSPFSVFSWATNRANDLKKLVGLQTPVKSQVRRGTCSIFSAVGMFESIIKTEFKEELDLSENYLEYVVQTRVRSSPGEGSDTAWNIPAFRDYGAILEAVWPYETDDWNSADISSSEKERAEKVCGEFKGDRKRGCLITHMDPENDKFELHARRFRRRYQSSSLEFSALWRDQDIREVLDSGHAVLLGLEFFYKAWNHRKMVEYGLGDRDMTAWDKGLVSAPTEEDIRVSRQHPAGHSILLVGYDTVKGVYYFKNSWGTEGFGMHSDLLGKNTTAGYGAISFDYAHNYGTAHQVYYRQ